MPQGVQYKKPDPHPPALGMSLDLTGLTGPATGSGWTVTNYDAGKKQVTVTKPEGETIRVETLPLDSAARIMQSRYNIANLRAPKTPKRFVEFVRSGKRWDFDEGNARVLGLDWQSRRFLVNGTYQGRAFQKWVPLSDILTLEQNHQFAGLIQTLGFQQAIKREEKKSDEKTNAPISTPITSTQPSVIKEESEQARQTDEEPLEENEGQEPGPTTETKESAEKKAVDAQTPIVASAVAAAIPASAIRATTENASVPSIQTQLTQMRAAQKSGGTTEPVALSTRAPSARQNDPSIRSSSAGASSEQSISVSLPISIAPLVAQANAILAGYHSQIKQYADRTNQTLAKLKSVSGQLERARQSATVNRALTGQTTGHVKNLQQEQASLRDTLLKIPLQKTDKEAAFSTLRAGIDNLVAHPRSNEAMDALKKLVEQIPSGQTRAGMANDSIHHHVSAQPTEAQRSALNAPRSVARGHRTDEPPKLDSITAGRATRPLPTITQFASAQQRSRIERSENISGYEGLSDARNDAFTSAGGTGHPVLPTIPKTYAATDQETRTFAEKQTEMNRTQADFLGQEATTAKKEESISSTDEPEMDQPPDAEEDTDAEWQTELARAQAAERAATAENVADTLDAAQEQEEAAQKKQKKNTPIIKQLRRVLTLIFSLGGSSYEYGIAIINQKFLHVKSLEKNYPPVERMEANAGCCVCCLGCLLTLIAFCLVVAGIAAPFVMKLWWFTKGNGS